MVIQKSLSDFSQNNVSMFTIVLHREVPTQDTRHKTPPNLEAGQVIATRRLTLLAVSQPKLELVHLSSAGAPH